MCVTWCNIKCEIEQCEIDRATSSGKCCDSKRPSLSRVVFDLATLSAQFALRRELMQLERPSHFQFPCKTTPQWRVSDQLDVIPSNSTSFTRQYIKRGQKYGSVDYESTGTLQSLLATTLIVHFCINVHRSCVGTIYKSLHLHGATTSEIQNFHFTTNSSLVCSNFAHSSVHPTTRLERAANTLETTQQLKQTPKLHAPDTVNAIKLMQPS